MGVPLGHKNSRSRRGKKISFEEKYPSNQYKIVKNNLVLSKDKKTFVYLRDGVYDEVTIPNGVEIIERNAFENSYIKILKLPKSLKLIKDYLWCKSIHGSTNSMRIVIF